MTVTGTPEMFNAPLVDLRIYTIKLRRLQEFVDIFDRLAIPVQIRYLGPPLGFYISDIGPQNQVVHLWGYKSLADYDARRVARDADREWPAYLNASADLIAGQENRFIRRVDFKSLAAGASVDGSAQGK